METNKDALDALQYLQNLAEKYYALRGGLCSAMHRYSAFKEAEEKGVSYYFLAIKGGGLAIRKDCKNETIYRRKADAQGALEEIKDGDIVMCSSSLDFPEEFTRKKWLVELCKKIRNHE